MDEILALKLTVPDNQIKRRSCTHCDKKIETKAQRMKSCSHIYHADCLSSHLRDNSLSSCPKCKKPFYPKKFACERCKSRHVQFRMRYLDSSEEPVLVINCKVCERGRVFVE